MDTINNEKGYMLAFVILILVIVTTLSMTLFASAHKINSQINITEKVNNKRNDSDIVLALVVAKYKLISDDISLAESSTFDRFRFALDTLEGNEYVNIIGDLNLDGSKVDITRNYFLSKKIASRTITVTKDSLSISQKIFFKFEKGVSGGQINIIKTGQDLRVKATLDFDGDLNVGDNIELYKLNLLSYNNSNTPGIVNVSGNIELNINDCDTSAGFGCGTHLTTQQAFVDENAIIVTNNTVSNINVSDMLNDYLNNHLTGGTDLSIDYSRYPRVSLYDNGKKIKAYNLKNKKQRRKFVSTLEKLTDITIIVDLNGYYNSSMNNDNFLFIGDMIFDSSSDIAIDNVQLYNIGNLNFDGKFSSTESSLLVSTGNISFNNFDTSEFRAGIVSGNNLNIAVGSSYSGIIYGFLSAVNNLSITNIGISSSEDNGRGTGDALQDDIDHFNDSSDSYIEYILSSNNPSFWLRIYRYSDAFINYVNDYKISGGSYVADDFRDYSTGNVQTPRVANSFTIRMDASIITKFNVSNYINVRSGGGLSKVKFSKNPIKK